MRGTGPAAEVEPQFNSDDAIPTPRVEVGRGRWLGKACLVLTLVFVGLAVLAPPSLAHVTAWRVPNYTSTVSYQTTGSYPGCEPSPQYTGWSIVAENATLSLSGWKSLRGDILYSPYAGGPTTHQRRSRESTGTWHLTQTVIDCETGTQSTQTCEGTRKTYAGLRVTTNRAAKQVNVFWGFGVEPVGCPLGAYMLGTPVHFDRKTTVPLKEFFKQTTMVQFPSQTFVGTEVTGTATFSASVTLKRFVATEANCVPRGPHPNFVCIRHPPGTIGHGG